MLEGEKLMQWIIESWENKEITTTKVNIDSFLIYGKEIK